MRAAPAAELLEILGSIINGFALPLKEEHKVGDRLVCRPKRRQLELRSWTFWAGARVA